MAGDEHHRVALPAPLAAEGVRSVCAAVAARPGEVVVVDVSGVPVDLALVDAVARIRRAAVLAGTRVSFRGRCPDLDRLLELTGLRDVVLPGSG